MPKFVKWVATPAQFIDPFFELAPVSAADVVFDLGSGDGRLLFAALERGAGRCVGIEIDGDMVEAARRTAKQSPFDGKISFVHADAMAQGLSEASTIFVYLLPSGCRAVRTKFEKELNPGTRVVTEMFPVPGWVPARVLELNGRSFYLYEMPAVRSDDYDSALTDTAYEDDWFYWP